jgi:hypothetical protein
MTKGLVLNPFAVKSPEDIAAEEAVALFVDVLTDHAKVEQPGHCMLNGPRGCGKSMIFRFLEADCQCLHRQCALAQLPYLGVLVRVRNTMLNLTELRRLSDLPIRNLLNEHFVVTYVTANVFSYLAKLPIEATKTNTNEARAYYNGTFRKWAQRCGARGIDELAQVASPTEVLRIISEQCNAWYHDTVQYAKRITFGRPEHVPFNGPLCSYMDFLFQLLLELRTLPFLPRKTVYLLLDDADLLNRTQTRVLNSWIATRTSDEVSIKVATQLGYKTYQTIAGGAIDTPHDYSEVNVMDLYTTRHGRYLMRVREIVEKRLRLAGIDKSPDQFFPAYHPQEQRILEIADDIRSGKHRLSGRGFRASDDVVRYARPEYFRELGGASKSTPSYFYAGFDQLVHISSGLIRYFLEPAGLMFGEHQARSPGSVPDLVDPSVQHDMVTRAAEELMTTQFSRISPEDPEIEDNPEKMSEFQRKKYLLQNLVVVLGGTFRAKLLSDDAERRVFSVAFTDTPDPALVELFELGVQAGYFHRKTIGNKDGTGRTPLYILTRRLAPYFKLDPSSFAGYVHVTSEKLWAAIRNPSVALRSIKRDGSAAFFEDGGQLPLFGDEGMVRT